MRYDGAEPSGAKLVDTLYWARLAAVLTEPSLRALHDGLAAVATNNRPEFDEWPDWREQADIIEAELQRRGIAFTSIP